MPRSVRRAGAVAGLLTLAVVTALGGAATAAPGTSKARTPSAALAAAANGSGGSGALKVVARGLNNPRGIGWGPDGALYVAESGRGGAGPCITGGESDKACFGRTGSVTRVTRHSQHRVLTGLPSVAAPDGTAASGPVDLGFSGWTGYLLMGNPGGGTETREQLPGAGRFGKLLKVDLRGIRSVADFPAFEEANNPDEGGGAEPGNEIDSNPNGLLVRHHSQLMTDAGGNDLLKVDHKGRISVLAVFPYRVVTAPGIGQVPMQAVPTTVVKGPDGAYYVGQLTGFPFPPGAARVYRVVPGHKPTVFARGFTNIIDIAFDRRGGLYVLEIAAGGLLNAPEDALPTGALIRVNRDGSRTTVASEGLNAPGGFVLGHDAAYVTNNSILPGAGEVVRVAL